MVAIQSLLRPSRALWLLFGIIGLFLNPPLTLWKYTKMDHGLHLLSCQPCQWWEVLPRLKLPHSHLEIDTRACCTISECAAVSELRIFAALWRLTLDNNGCSLDPHLNWLPRPKSCGHLGGGLLPTMPAHPDAPACWAEAPMMAATWNPGPLPPATPPRPTATCHRQPATPPRTHSSLAIPTNNITRTSSAGLSGPTNIRGSRLQPSPAVHQSRSRQLTLHNHMMTGWGARTRASSANPSSTIS